MGDGYLTVETPIGNEAYTRAGNIKVDTFGAMSINGFPVVGENGPIVVPDFQKIEISERGRVSVIPPGGGAEVEVGTLKMVKPPINQLQKRATACYTA